MSFRPLLHGSLISLCWSAAAQGQTPPASPLFAQALEGWTAQNTTLDSFQYDTDTLRVTGTSGWLRSPRQYGDFELHGQVRFVEPDSDSGIFLRVESGTDFIRGWPGDAYQVQMREISVNTSDSPLPLANLYRHRVADGSTDYQRERVFASYTGVGEWQDFTIRVEGSVLTVELNGALVTQARGLENLRGHIGFQSEQGVIDYRNLVLWEL